MSDEIVHIDRRVFSSIRELMSARFPNFIREFLSGAALNLDNAKKAATEHNANAVANAVHSLKSSSASVGFKRMSQIAKTIEAAADSMDNGGADEWESVSANMLALEEELLVVKRILDQEADKA